MSGAAFAQVAGMVLQGLTQYARSKKSGQPRQNNTWGINLLNRGLALGLQDVRPPNEEFYQGMDDDLRELRELKQLEREQRRNQYQEEQYWKRKVYDAIEQDQLMNRQFQDAIEREKLRRDVDQYFRIQQGIRNDPPPVNNFNAPMQYPDNVDTDIQP